MFTLSFNHHIFIFGLVWVKDLAIIDCEFGFPVPHINHQLERYGRQAYGEYMVKYRFSLKMPRNGASFPGLSSLVCLRLPPERPEIGAGNPGEQISIKSPQNLTSGCRAIMKMTEKCFSHVFVHLVVFLVVRELFLNR